MVPELHYLTASEMELIYKAPILVCILIAGADGEIDRKEIKEAIRHVEKGENRLVSSVSELFHEVAQDFEDKMKILLQDYPYESTQRNPLIADELAGLSALWRKIDRAFAEEFYASLLVLAEKVAGSSGGLLGYNTIADEEARYIKLGMIKNPAST
ncbi:MAG: hypothetical protein KF845_11035 [Cyclobacteriaceae bacterium]|nr:hypothetical protein [Cyclobacteriaceae bacterium]